MKAQQQGAPAATVWPSRLCSCSNKCTHAKMHPTPIAAPLQEYAAWKEQQLKEGAEAKKKGKEKLTEKKLKQAVLSFAAGSSGDRGGGGGAGQQAGAAAAAAAPEQQQQQQQPGVAGSSREGASPPKQAGGSKAAGGRPKGRTPSKQAALAQHNS